MNLSVAGGDEMSINLQRPALFLWIKFLKFTIAYVSIDTDYALSREMVNVKIRKSSQMTDFFDKSQKLYIEKKDGIGRLVLNRAEKHNAITEKMWLDFPAYLNALDEDKDVRVILITSAAPKAFSAGADIVEFGEIATNPERRERNRMGIRDAQRTLARLKKPTIAMISGVCIGGGCGVSLHCDFRFAAEGSKFGVTPAKLGLVYSLNDTKHLVDLVGPSKAKSILFTGRMVSADEALTIGLIDELFTVEKLEEETLAFAAQMVAVSQYSIQGSKRVIRRILDGQSDDDTQTSRWFTDAHDEIDNAEGVKAFMEKRKPNFKWNG